MNKLLLSVFMAGLSFMALPHTENEKLEVGRYMARFVKASTSYDHIDEALSTLTGGSWLLESTVSTVGISVGKMERQGSTNMMCKLIKENKDA